MEDSVLYSFYFWTYMQPNYYRVIKKATSFSGLEMISHAYGQIAGVEVVGFYLWLITEANIQAFNSEIRTPISRLQNAFNPFEIKKNQVPEWIYKTISKLESLGLVRTFFSPKRSEITFCIIDPLDWKEFKQNKQLKEKLVEAMGKVEYDRNCLAFDQIDNLQFDNALEISANFEVNFTANQSDVWFGFNFEELHKELVKNKLLISLDEKAKTLINGYFEKYKLSLQQITDCIINSSTQENELDFQKLEMMFFQIVKNDTAPILETVSNNKDFFYKNEILDESTKKAITDCHVNFNSEKYLFLLYGKIDESQLQLVRQLRSDYQLLDKVINLVLDFSFWKNNGMWREKYILKIAQSIKINNSQNSYEKTLNNFIRALTLNKKHSLNNIKPVEKTISFTEYFEFIK